MKLAFCLFNYFPFGGLQRDFMRIARLCRDHQHEVHVYTMSWEGEFEPGLQIHLLKSSSWQNHTRVRDFIKQVQLALTANQFDVVIGFNKMPNLDFYYAADVCYQARVREQRPWWYRLLPRYQQWLSAEKEVFSRRKSTQILLISSTQQNEFAYYYGTPAFRFHLLPPGIDKNRLPPEDAAIRREKMRAQHGVKENDIILLMVGSGFRTKGVDRAILALASLPENFRQHCQLWVIGQDKADYFQQLAQRLRIEQHIQFLGAKDNVTDYYLAADLLLHPAYHENTGTVILEAMINGLPVLTVANCGYAFYVEKAKAGEVLSYPFSQQEMNERLNDMLQAAKYAAWKKNGLLFGKTADIYRLPEIVVELIENKSQPSSFPSRFQDWMNLQGECFRQHKNRTTQRVIIDEQAYFIKQHRGIGWWEIIKNLLQCRLPIISAKNEWQAIYKLKSLGIKVPEAVVYDEQGMNPARRESYILLREVAPAQSLEELVKHSLSLPLKRLLIAKVAKIARVMHGNQMNHRDFYLCHFLLDTQIDLHCLDQDNLSLTLIDLHRAKIHKKLAKRWLIKDLAGLYFSSLASSLTKRDYYRFMQVYRGKKIKAILQEEKVFWQKIKSHGEKLYRDHGR